MNLKERMIEVRTIHNLSQEELAKKMGISKAKLLRYENGKEYPELKELQKFCKIFNVTLEELLGNEKPLKPKKNIHELYKTFAEGISIGCLVLFWTLSLFFLIKHLDSSRVIALTSLIIGLLISLGVFINYGMKFEDDNKKLLKKDKKYTKIEKKESNKKNYPLMILGLSLIGAGATEYLLLKDSMPKDLLLALFFLIFAVAMALIIYSGIILSRFVEEAKVKKENPHVAKISAVTMFLALFLFLYLGISKNLWHPYWALIPGSGIVCGILNYYFNK